MITVQGVQQADNNVIAMVLQSWYAPRENQIVIAFKRAANTESPYHLLHTCIRLVEIVESTAVQKRIVVNYDDFIADTAHATNRIVNAFSLQLDVATSLPVMTCSRHPISDDELQLKLGDAAQFYQRLLACLDKLAKDEWQFHSDEFLLEWKTILDQYQTIYPFYLYLDKLHREQKVWLRKIRNIQKSIFWKLSWPLRMIEDALRTMRRAGRIARR